MVTVERAALAVVREPAVEIVIPVNNEERDLERSVRRLRAYLDACFPFHTTITVADYASTDATHDIGGRLAADIEGVRYMRISDRGRGRAIAAAWLTSRADVLVHIAGDPSAHVEALLPLVAPVASRHSDVAVGIRVKGDFESRAYNSFLKVVFSARFVDRHSRLTALRGDVARRLVPQVEDRDGFFDTELLVLAERAGLRIHEVPIEWDVTPGVAPSLREVAGVWRVMRRRRDGRLKVMTADGA